jgi:hypothetical protein
MGWKCKNCPAKTDSDNLDFPIMHETLHPDHHVEPDIKTIVKWGAVLGQVEHEKGAEQK